MKKKINRLAVTLTTLGIGIALALVLLFLGDRTKGPLEDLFSFTSRKISDIESGMIVASRTDLRKASMPGTREALNNHQYLIEKDSLWLGAFDNQIENGFEPILNLEDTLDARVSIIHIYTAWGSKPEHQFPEAQVRSIVALGSIPLITWEPWLSAFDENTPNLRPANQRDKNGLADVANGKYDFYIRTWANKAKLIGSTIIVRWAHEMNNPYRYPWGPQNNQPQNFIDAFTHIASIFKAEGANNVKWVWGPHPAYSDYFNYYPPDSLVNFIGIGTLNYGDAAVWSKWWSFADIFNNCYVNMAPLGKPIILTEFASLAVGGNRANWYSEAMRNIIYDYPLVRAVVLFHYNADATVTQQKLDWYLINDTAVTRVMRAWLSLPESLPQAVQ